jgi:hypothetical protein
MTIIVCYQKRHQQSSCSLYLIASAAFGLIGVSWRLGSNLNALDHLPGPFPIYLALSRMCGYILQVTSAVNPTMIVLACIDRFTSSSSRANISKN